MLFKKTQLDAIVAGRVSLAFRRWKRPTVKSGGTLRTHLGVLAIRSVRMVTDKEITDADAMKAGFDSRDALLDRLNAKTGGALYRIELRYAGADPRMALRQRSEIDAAEIDKIKAKLNRMDAASRHGPWTEITLRLIAKQPGTRAADLASKLGVDKMWFKQNVRKLKNLGLTESLPEGYRLSARGQAFMKET